MKTITHIAFTKLIRSRNFWATASLMSMAPLLAPRGCDFHTPPGGPGGGGSSSACGGLQGLACEEGEFCNYAPDAMCGAADQTGTCDVIPEACTREYAPVCGCDDQTYGNECEAHAAGVSVATLGECDAGNGGQACGGLLGLACEEGEFCNYPLDAICGAADQTGTCDVIPEACTREYAPVCGCDDQTYGNECEAHAAGISVATLGACDAGDAGDGGQACGGLLGLGCEEGEFCNYPLDAMCGAADQPGTCDVIPEVCTKEYAPVCGCDDQTYGNECEAHAAGISVVALGECSN